jgi:outer membrane protein assembly factor BamB
MSGSPLVVDEMVIVGAGGTNGRSLVAYDKTSGDVIWAGGDDVASYASPAVATLGGVRQVLSVNQDWVVGHRLEDGEPLWRHAWPGKSDSNATASQAVAIEDRNWVFLSKGYEIGSTLLAIEQDDGGNWSATPVWDPPIAARMKTKMTNVAIRDGLVFGLDAGILQCIDLETGRQRWKGGRYGNGQILLVDNVILVTTEEGELAIVEATDESFRELAKIPVIEGRTWNNPALYGRYLLMRSEEEVACLELPLSAEAP